jgi:MYXO-CTERM domain-containing protein
MRAGRLAVCLFGSLVLTSCSSTPTPGAEDGRLGTATEAIAYGSPDTAHSAVVALLGTAGTNMYSECSGTVVQIKSGQGYVLTAAHCCNNGAPSIVVVGADYSAGEQSLLGQASPPAYAVTAGSIYYDTDYDPSANAPHDDFCMLKFAAPAGQAVIPVATPADGLSQGATVEHVGFGVTDATMNNSGRRTATAPIDLGLDSYTLTSSQGGPSHIPGVCEGDSGGPALFPAGAAPSQQKVVGTTSYGNNSDCASNTENVCMRVTSASAPGGFIANFLADTPSGSQPGSSSSGAMSCGLTTNNPTCDDCINTSCCAEATACAADSACIPCIENATCTSDAAAANLLNCLSASCASQCANGGSTSSSTSSSTTSSSTSASSSSSGGSASGSTSSGASGSASSGKAGYPTSGNSSGCSVSSDSSPASSASLMGILLGAALAFSRRRPRSPGA